MKKYFLILFIIILSVNLFSQTRIDSLEEKLQTVTGKEKVDVLNDIVKVYREILPEKSIEYGNQALLLSQELGYKKGEALALIDIGTAFSYLGDYDKSLEYHLKSWKIMEEIKDNEGIALSLDNIGADYSTLGNYEKALEYSLKSLSIDEKIGNNSGIARSLNNIGIVYSKLGNSEKALEYYLKTLEIDEESENKIGISGSLTNIGLVYFNLDNYEMALENFLKALKICEEIEDKYCISIAQANIGLVHEHLNNFNEALEYSLKSLKISEEIENKYGITVTLNNIGSIYIKIHDYNKSLSYLEQSLTLAKEINAKLLIQDNYEDLSDLYSAKDDFQKALENYKLYSEVKDSIYTEESNEKIAEMQTKYETEKKEKENEILRKNNEIQKFEITRQQNLRNSFIAISILVLILVFVIYHRYLAKQKANKILNGKNKQITQQKNQLSQTLDKLRETQKMLVDTAHRAGMAEIASEILHNVGNVLNSVKVSSQILKEKIKLSKVNNLQKVLALMEEHTDDIGDFITSDEKGKMLPTYLIKVGKALKDEQDSSLKEISDLHNGISHIEEIVAVQQNYAGVSGIIESVSLSKMMDDVLRMYQDSFSEYKIKVVKYYKESTPISIEKGKLMQVFVNLLKNAQESLILTESENKAITINISENKENKSQMVEITDNGVGIKKDNLDRIFSYGFTTKKDSQGFGLHTSALAMAELKGKLLAYSDGEGLGAKFSVIILTKIE